MDQFGSDISEADGQTLDKRKEQRIKRGECPNCRRKTHKISRFPFGKREPLTVEGEVVNGHCLRCMPAGGYLKRESHELMTPEFFVVPTRSGTEVSCDDMTVASEITMDPFLTAPPVPGPNGRPSATSSSRCTSSTSRSHSMANRFESVSEQTSITEFEKYAESVAGHLNKLENEKRERRETVREHESLMINGGKEDLDTERRNLGVGGGIEAEDDTEESDEEEELWENHEHLLRHMEQHQQHLHHTFSNSDRSISITNIKKGLDSTIDRHGKRSHNKSSVAGATLQQKFHPLSRIALFSNSENSVSLHDDTGSHASAPSADCDRIFRLCQGSRSSLTTQIEKMCQGSRSSLTMEVEKVPTISLAIARPIEGERQGNNSEQQRLQAQRSLLEQEDTNRFCLKRLSSSPNSPDVEADSKSICKDDTTEKGIQKEGNRFNLTSGRIKARAEKESNRFSLNLTDLQGRRRRNSMPNTPNLLMELNASKNWDSMEIMRDAAAEANGEDLDAAVDALFGLVDRLAPSNEILDTTAHSKQGEPNGADKGDIKNTVLSGGPLVDDNTVLASTIKQRRRRLPSAIQKILTIKDIPAIIDAVKLCPTDKRLTERAFQSLFLLATDPDPEGCLARKEILAEGGMETLVSAIWDHMQHSQVLLALFHALWAISVFNGKGEKSSKASPSKIQKCGVLDGLLFAMQTHSDDMPIQESGCDLITRLSGLLPNDIADFKSAVILLSSNIQSIGTDTKAFSSCLDALNSLCQLSDENKREFAKAGDECHSAIIRGLTSSEETRELACQLYWCVTSDRSVVSSLSLNGLLSKKILEALKTVPRTKSVASVHFNVSQLRQQHYQLHISDLSNSPDTTGDNANGREDVILPFVNAACGTLANLALESNNHSKMIDLGAVPILCEAIYIYDFSEDVNSAACTALANLSASRNIRKTIVTQGGIPALFSALKSTSDNADAQSEVFRALHNLCESSSDGKLAIVANLEIIIASFFRHEGVKYIQQNTCSILWSLSAEEKCRKSMVTMPGTFDALAKIMKSNQTKKMVQKAACSTLQKLSMETSRVSQLLSKGFHSLVIDAMHAYSDCEELLENSCMFLMNMGSKSHEASVEICSGGAIHCIVKAMLTIPASASLQQVSCGAIYALTKEDAHKSIAVSEGAVDAVIYLMLVHPTKTKVLENAISVLANLSSLKKCTKTIADAGGVSTVIETMRLYPSSTKLIISGSRFILNMAVSDSDYANEALEGITPILGCMDEHPDCEKLVEESCKALRYLVLKSECCKDRLISADGVAVIGKTMEGDNTSQRWQTLLLDELFQ